MPYNQFLQKVDLVLLNGKIIVLGLGFFLLESWYSEEFIILTVAHTYVMRMGSNQKN
jgi:hypothetical protein